MSEILPTAIHFKIFKLLNTEQYIRKNKIFKEFIIHYLCLNLIKYCWLELIRYITVEIKVLPENFKMSSIPKKLNFRYKSKIGFFAGKIIQMAVQAINKQWRRVHFFDKNPEVEFTTICCRKDKILNLRPNEHIIAGFRKLKLLVYVKLVVVKSAETHFD